MTDVDLVRQRLPNQGLSGSNLQTAGDLELDNAIFKRSNTALTQALGNGAHWTGAELASVPRRAGIDAGDLRPGYLLMHAELEGMVRSGAWRGKQFSRAL